MEIKKVGVAGCGLMGSGIVEVCARSGYPVRVLEVNQERLDKGIGSIRSNQDALVKKGKITEQVRDANMGRIHGTTKIEDFKDCDIVIEAVLENMDEKKKIFAALDKVCPEHTILTSNTSCLSIIDMATATKRPQKVVGTHFFNPVPVLNLVEIIETIVSSKETVQIVKPFCESLGKKPIMCKDTPGFIVSRLTIVLIVEAIRILDSGVATKEDIDQGALLGLNHPMGPLTVADFVGLDTIYYVSNALYDEFKDRVYVPPPLLKKMVTSGLLGRKTGQGFYSYK